MSVTSAEPLVRMVDYARLRAAYERAKADLLAERTPDGHWIGELSSSALSTATAVSALAVVRNVGWDKPAAGASPPASKNGSDARSTQYSVLSTQYNSSASGQSATLDLNSLICGGVAYLATQQNPDGGFGDTDLSHSNIATTMLVVAALHLAGATDRHKELLIRANAYIDSRGRLKGLRARYGIDKTFVVPIMTNCALAGLVDWREVDPLPFELACVPQSWYRFVGMPVVSYAIPALVAIGQARYFHAPPRNPLTRLVRWLSLNRSLKVLRRMQPGSGGYLEATPLTSFVVMSLASTGVQGSKFKVQSSVANEVIREGVNFLINSVRPDSSWPIDTNLATWNTTLAINALAGAGEDVAELLGPQCLEWLLSCQHTERHPFTGADPGGFGWSDLSGAVPDADDTPGALLALSAWYHSPSCSEQKKKQIRKAAELGIRWLLSLQNRDGGWPTFCRGWGRLPFDRSGADLTAHALRALLAWHPHHKQSPFPVWGREHLQIDAALGRGVRYLAEQQRPDGSWLPLWFGNQDHPEEENPVYGTAKVLMADIDNQSRRDAAWLRANQNGDGGWGSGVWAQSERARSAELGARNGVGREQVTNPHDRDHSVLSTQYPVRSTAETSETHDGSIPNPKSGHPQRWVIPNLQSSVEETALAVEALLSIPNPDPRTPSPASDAVDRGLAWLIERVERGEHRQPAPIGFYFAKLWYYERLYPLTFTVAALGRACRQFDPPASTGTTPWKTQP